MSHCQKGNSVHLNNKKNQNFRGLLIYTQKPYSTLKSKWSSRQKERETFNRAFNKSKL